MAVRIVGFEKLPRSGLVQHCIHAAGHSALGLQRHFEEVKSADNPALAKSVGPGAYAP